MITLSRSILEDAARCKRKFFYKHVLGLKDQGSSQGASEGTLIHAGLAAAFNYVKDAQYRRNVYNALSWDETSSILKRVACQAMADMIVQGYSLYRGEKQLL